MDMISEDMLQGEGMKVIEEGDSMATIGTHPYDGNAAQGNFCNKNTEFSPSFSNCAVTTCF